MAVSFNFVDTKDILKQKNKLKSWIKSIVEQNGMKAGDISYIFCSDDYLLEINQNYLQHDFYTDIITFDYTAENKIAGDLFISIDRVMDNAKELNVSFEEELHRVIIHGVLHLLGFKDKSDKEAKQMRIKEQECLKTLM